jgi:hypothetical protein
VCCSPQNVLTVRSTAWQRHSLRFVICRTGGPGESKESPTGTKTSRVLDDHLTPWRLLPKAVVGCTSTTTYPVMTRLSSLCLLLVVALPSTVHGFPSKRLITNPFDGRKRVLLHPPPRHDDDHDDEDEEANGDGTNTTHSNSAMEIGVADAVPSPSTELNDDNNNNMAKNTTTSTTTPTISSVGKWLTTLSPWVGAAFVLMALFLRAFSIW